MEVERREHYPYFDSELKHLPEAKKWKVGEKYYVLLEVKMKRLSVTKSEDGEERGSAGFDITGIEVQKKPKKDYRDLPSKDDE